MHERAETLARLQRIIDRSAATAGPAIRRNVIGGGWSMSAAEFVAFWGESRMAAVSTASAAGQVHAVPLDIHLVDGVFYIPTFPDSLRRRDHAANPPAPTSGRPTPTSSPTTSGRWSSTASSIRPPTPAPDRVTVM